jgi:hypothetical protein
MKRRALTVTVCLLVAMAVALLWSPRSVQCAEAWLHYRLTGYLPPPLLAGRNGRIFLGNHGGSPPGSLIADVCGTGIGPAAIASAEASVRSVLAAGHATGLPFRFLIVPTQPRLYPEDLPAGTPCASPAADRLVAALHDPAVAYPVDFMESLKPKFDVLPRRHFHWAGEGPLRVAEHLADGMGLHRAITLTLRPDNRASDLNSFYPGLGLHDRVGTPNLRAAGVSQCWGDRCHPAIPEAIVHYTRPGTGRLLVLADSFGDEFGGELSEYAANVWLVRMNILLEMPGDSVAKALRDIHPDAIVVVYHDAGALALDSASRSSLAISARLLADVGLPPSSVDP